MVGFALARLRPRDRRGTTSCIGDSDGDGSGERVVGTMAALSSFVVEEALPAMRSSCWRTMAAEGREVGLRAMRRESRRRSQKGRSWRP
jgi:hypothetical protein